MPTYSVHAVNVSSFPLGESDKVLTLFSAERGLIRAVAKGARKPGSKIAGRADLLSVNRVLIATGRSLDIITQAETVESFPKLRTDLTRLSYCLYYAELTAVFGQGLSEESDAYYAFLIDSLRKQAEAKADASALCLEFEMSLLALLGYKPELTVCVLCRSPLSDYSLAGFHNDLGGIVCEKCFMASKRSAVAEDFGLDVPLKLDRHITPLVWKRLVLASSGSLSRETSEQESAKNATRAALRLIQSYIEFRAGKKMRALELIERD
ncbi:MAG TPA: DNA repair protein RecO [Candidatus Obscuribacterales bacterium]